MTDSLQVLINKFGAKTLNLTDQTPTLLHEWMVWKLIAHISILATSILVIISLFIFTKKLLERDADNDIILFIDFLFGIPSIVIMIKYFISTFQMIIAPKIWILEHIK